MDALSSARVSIVDVTDESSYALIPPCADPGFDHRSCDYWEDADRGTKAIRLDWIAPSARSAEPAAPAAPPANPFLADLEARRANPLSLAGPGGPAAGAGAGNPFRAGGDAVDDNPFAPRRAPRPGVPDTAPRKLRLLARGLGIAGSYAKVLLLDDVPAAYCQFGPLTAYPRAQRTRDLYPALPATPLPAVITCIATTAQARGAGLGRRLVAVVCEDLAERGFAAVETYPAIGADPDTTSAADPEFWATAGFVVAAADERFPVMRRELV